MCTRYVSPEDREIEDFWRIDRRKHRPRDWKNLLTVFPLSQATFIRRAREETGDERELVVGQWGLIPPWSKTSVPQNFQGKRLSTVNARSEGVEKAPAYSDAWKRGRRCIIPAASFDEPNWETGANVWWRFRRSDGAPWGLAGLWSAWLDKESGEEHESFTMLTMNADAHPLMSRMHKPDPKLAPDKQDNRSVIPLEAQEFDLWLAGTIEEAKTLLKLAPVERFDAGPAEA